MQINVDAIISRIARQVVSELRPLLANARPNHGGQANPALRNSQAMAQQVQELQSEVESLKSCINGLLGRLAEQNGRHGGQVQQQQPQFSLVDYDQQAKSQTSHNGSKDSQESQADEEKAERWVRENMATWLDQPCPFRNAEGRSWRKLAQNEGERITMNGKGSQVPRAYLHAIESWQACSVWNRLKAKVALEAAKNGNGGVASHYGHPVEIGG
jgi:hypothetical protein